MMTFLVDNNIGKQVAAGMSGFGEDVVHLTDHFEENAPDTEWLAEVGNKGWFVITRDKHIRRRPVELRAVTKHNVGMFVLAGKNQDRCKLIQQVVRNWPRIKEHARRQHRPFAFSIPARGTKFRRLPLDGR